MASIKLEQLTEAMSLFDGFINEAEDLLVKRKKATSETDSDCLKLEKEIESCKRRKERFTTRMRSLLVQLENEENFNLREQKSTRIRSHQQQSPAKTDKSEQHTLSTPRLIGLSAKTGMEVARNKRTTTPRSAAKAKLATEAEPSNGSGRQSETLRNDPVSRAGKEFWCVFCKTWLPTSALLRNHVDKVHDGRSYHSCHICGKGFAKKGTLTIHRQIHREKTFSCVFCNSRSYSKRNLGSHIMSHILEKPYWCNICDHECSGKTHLIDHMRIHTGAKPFTCEICRKSFRVRSNLNRHLRSHTGEKPNVCNVCDRGFTHSGELKSHTRTHTGERPYKCEICGHVFAQHRVLVCHMRIHTGEKPYSCQVCGKMFSESGACKKHQKTHEKKNFS